MSETASFRYRLSRAEFEHGIAAGLFDAKFELVNGDLHTMTPDGTRHRAAMNLVARQVGRIFVSGAAYQPVVKVGIQRSTRWA